MPDDTRSVAIDHVAAAAERAIRLRGARDRLVDLLGFGETYPLQDVPVRAEELIVPIETTAKIPIDPGQSDVLYQLRDRGKPVNGRGVRGKGGNYIVVIAANGEAFPINGAQPYSALKSIIELALSKK